MENLFPKIDLFPRLTKIGKFLGHIGLPDTGYPSDHAHFNDPLENVGGAAGMLDDHMITKEAILEAAARHFGVEELIAQAKQAQFERGRVDL